VPAYIESLQDIQRDSEDSETQNQQPLPPVLPPINDDVPPLENDANRPDFVPVIEDIRIAREFINMP
jgi:hypothetical protein